MVTSLSSPFFLSLVGAFRLSTALLIIAVQNPVHALLLLIALFGLGSLLLLTLQREYFALLFLVVYVGAIVVLFLFVIRRLEIKRVNLAARFRDLLSPRALLLALIGVEILLVLSADSFDLAPVLSALPKSYRNGFFSLPLTERNQYIDWSTLLVRLDPFRAFGSLLFTEVRVALLLVATLLLIARLGAIAITLPSVADPDPDQRAINAEAKELRPLRSLKRQERALQARRHPDFQIAI